MDTSERTFLFLINIAQCHFFVYIYKIYKQDRL